jgi:hypothetical protein
LTRARAAETVRSAMGFEERDDEAPLSASPLSARHTPPPSSAPIEGKNFRIGLEDGALHAKVWRDADVATDQANTLADQLVDMLIRRGQGACSGVLVDLSEASIMAPGTEAAFARLLAYFRRIDRPVALVSAPNAMQRLQLQRLIRENAPGLGVVLEAS